MNPRQHKDTGIREYYDAVSQILEWEQQVLSYALPHHGERGRNDEERLRRLLTRILPRRFSVGTGFLECSQPHVQKSRQIDVVISDEFWNAGFCREAVASVFPIETVYATIEVKTRLTGPNLTDALDCIAGVNKLARAKRYAHTETVPKEPERPEHFMGRDLWFPFVLNPRAYVFAYGASWKKLGFFEAAVRKALGKNRKAHLHGLVVLDRNWFIRQHPHEAEVKIDVCEGNCLQEFVTCLLSDLASFPMFPMYNEAYLLASDGLDAPTLPGTGRANGRNQTEV